MEVIMDKAQDIVKAFTRIADDLANLEVRKAALKRLETRNGLEMIVAIGRDEGAGDGPIREEAIINNVEALDLAKWGLPRARVAEAGSVDAPGAVGDGVEVG
jgi:hypothetical protein